MEKAYAERRFSGNVRNIFSTKITLKETESDIMRKDRIQLF